MGRGSGHKKADGGLLPAPGLHTPASDDSNGHVAGAFDVSAYIGDEATPDKPLKGQQFAITGLLTGTDRFHLEKDLRSQGAIIRNRVAPELRCLIVGETTNGESPKMRWAKRNGVEMIAWADFARSFYAADTDLLAKIDESAATAAAQTSADDADSAADDNVAAVAPAYTPVTPPAPPTPDTDDLIVTDGVVHPLVPPAPTVPVDDVAPIGDDELLGEVEDSETAEADTPIYEFAEGDALAGECYVIAGSVNGISGAELTARLQAQGAIVADTVTIGVDAVIKGDNLGDDDYQTKLDAAERYDVPLLAYGDIAKHL